MRNNRRSSTIRTFNGSLIATTMVRSSARYWIGKTVYVRAISAGIILSNSGVIHVFGTSPNLMYLRPACSLRISSMSASGDTARSGTEGCSGAARNLPASSPWGAKALPTVFRASSSCGTRRCFCEPVRAASSSGGAFGIARMRVVCPPVEAEGFASGLAAGSGNFADETPFPCVSPFEGFAGSSLLPGMNFFKKDMDTTIPLDTEAGSCLCADLHQYRTHPALFLFNRIVQRRSRKI